MDCLQLRQQHLLHDFEEFEREFLPAYDPHKDINPKSDNGKSKRSWLEEMEQNFIDKQLNFRTLHSTCFNPPTSPVKFMIKPTVSDQISDIPENSAPLTECLDVGSPNEKNDISYSRPLVLGSCSKLGVPHRNQNSDNNNIAYPPTASPTMLQDQSYEITNQVDTSNPMSRGSPNSDILTSNRIENIKTSDEQNPIDLINFDDFQFDLSVLDLINFDIPTSPQLEIDKAAYINKANSDYGEEFAKKVEENLRILQEAMKRTSRCCNQGGRVDEGVCCQGKCWKYMESRLRALQKIPRGRKRKGFELTPEQVALKKERQKIRNRISAAAAYNKEKAYIESLQAQVQELKAENKIRKNFNKFLESASQIPPLERISRGRTTSGTI